MMAGAPQTTQLSGTLFVTIDLGKTRERDNFRKRSVLFRDVRLFINTIHKAVETMQAAGIPAAAQKMQFDDYIEYRVRIPLIEPEK